MGKFKLGLIVENDPLNSFNLELYKKINKKNLDIKFLVNKKRISKFSVLKETIKLKGINKIFSIISFVILSIFEKFVIKIFFKNKFKIDYLNSKDNKKLELINRKKIYLNPKINNNVYEYKNEDIKEIKKLKFDLLIRLNYGILKGDILNSSRLGVYSVHCGDNRKYRGGPSGFWEVLNQVPTTGFIIQKLNNKLDGGDIIFRGQIPTQLFYKLNSDLVLKRSYMFLSKLILDISKGNYWYQKEKKVILGKIYTYPSLSSIIKYIFKTYSYLVIKYLKKTLNDKEFWKINYQRGTLDKLIIREPDDKYNLGKFIADPFIFFYQDEYYIFAEKYDFIRKKGCINIYKLVNDHLVDLGVILQENFHLSFPFVFEHDNKIFICPESYEAKEIRIYECTNFPMEWKYKKTILKNISAVDTIIFKDKKYWYLLTNIDSSKSCDFSSELHCYYTSNKSPITSKWIKHEKNPLIYNANIGRNAGLIKYKNYLLRVSQKIGFDSYGAGFQLNKIKEISPKIYKEEFINLKNYKKGFYDRSHHISYSNGLIAYDIKF